MTREQLAYLDAHRAEAYDLLLTLARIPAPSNHEEERAAFCRDWLIAQGAEGVYIDDVCNVIYPIGVTDDSPVTVYMAHSDVVFPDTEPLPLRVADGRIYCPGIGDDTANAVALMTAMKYLATHPATPRDGGLLLVINSGEEGLGNLRGSRAIVDRYGDRMRALITFDGYAGSIVNRAVGSRRYRVAVETEGGHSWGNFGRPNAIARLAALIDALYAIPLPEGGKTTFNVGTISGGTSVNTVAQQAEMLYEFRSDRLEHLDTMEAGFRAAVARANTDGVEVRVTLLGERPCGEAKDAAAQEALLTRATDAIRTHYGITPTYHAGSTDCNIPLSRGIPAVCLACLDGDGAHTREEYVDIDSLAPGLAVALEMVLHHF